MSHRLLKTSGLLAGVLGVPLLSEVRVRRAAQPASDMWRHQPVESRGSTLLGTSFRPLQAVELGLDPWETLSTLLALPIQLLRLSAYWNQIQPRANVFQFDDLDRQIDAVERAGKRIILCVGPVKSFGYPEYFVPDHLLERPLPEGRVIGGEEFQSLLDASTAFVTRVVERYRDRESIVAWQVEHEAVDPLGVEHSWRLSEDFVRQEVDAARIADSGRPIVMNGFLPTSSAVRLQQWWRTRDQGDSLAVASRLSDIVGIDFYPVNGLVGAGKWSVYLDGSRLPWQQSRMKHLVERSREQGKRLMIAEGQAEPWETVTTPPSPRDRVMYSCPPERLIANYSQCLQWNRRGADLYAYLFWGAEYWVLRQRQGDGSYLAAVSRVLAES